MISHLLYQEKRNKNKWKCSSGRTKIAHTHISLSTCSTCIGGFCRLQTQHNTCSARWIIFAPKLSKCHFWSKKENPCLKLVNYRSQQNHAELCLHAWVSCAERAWIRVSHTLCFSVCMHVNESLCKVARASELTHLTWCMCGCFVLKVTLDIRQRNAHCSSMHSYSKYASHIFVKKHHAPQARQESLMHFLFIKAM